MLQQTSGEFMFLTIIGKNPLGHVFFLQRGTPLHFVWKRKKNQFSLFEISKKSQF